MYCIITLTTGNNYFKLPQAVHKLHITCLFDIIGLDVDECADGSVVLSCSPGLCVNTIGSYLCACPPGYQLAHQDKACVGKHFYIIHNLYFIVVHSVWSTYL